jgi:hypothetical protein
LLCISYFCFNYDRVLGIEEPRLLPDYLRSNSEYSPASKEE